MNMSCFWRRGLSLLIFSVFLFQQIAPVAAQSVGAGLSQQPSAADIANNQNDLKRSTGKSFGSDSKDRLNDDLQRDASGSFGSRIPSAGQQPIFGITYQVHVSGEVQRPGTYRIPASTRLSEVMQMAGGILDRGSERRLELRRRDGTRRRVDLTSFKTTGNLDANPYLLDDDVIFVPLKGKVVQIEGSVKRPGYYELIGERAIEDLVRLAGGFTPGAEGAGNLKVIRYEGTAKQLLDVENDAASRKGFQLENADVVVVPHIFTDNKKFDYNLGRLPGEKGIFYPSYEERVFVLGAVALPGPYAFNPYYDVRQYLTIAGGTTKLAKSKKIKIITADGKTMKASNVTNINPGDTIVVPEKYMAPESFATLVVGITASIVGITSAVVTLAR